MQIHQAFKNRMLFVERVGFCIQVRVDRLEEYRQIHEKVWPELLAELKAAGIRNYTLWMRPDGLQFGYLECDNWATSCVYLAESRVHALWQESMKEFVITPADRNQGGQPISMLSLAFLME